MIIYKITNRINGKVYIGQTVGSLEARWKRHCTNSSGCTAIRDAIQKYGKENFTVEQIDAACDREELNYKEGYWIARYNSMVPKGYNLCDGGESTGGYIHTEESKAKMSSIRKGRFCGENHPRFGKPHSEETKKKISENRKGKHCGEEHHAYGKRQKPESIAKMRESKLGTKHSEGTIEKMKAAHKGKRVLCVETGEIFNSIREASKKYDLNCGSMCCVCKGKGKTLGGYHWRYADSE